MSDTTQDTDMQDMPENGLTSILKSLIDNTDRDCIEMGQIFDVFEHRGFGPLLIAPTVLVILPTGAIPGVPAICGVFIFLISIQILFGKKTPWLPKKLKSLSFSKDRFRNGFKNVKPYTQKIDTYLSNRLEFLAESDVAKRLIAFAAVLMSIAITFIGFIPMLPALFGMPILFLALGLSTKDGILIGLGFLGAICVSLGFLYFMS